MVTSRSPRAPHPDDSPEGFRLFADRREGQKRFPAEGLRSRGGRRHPQGGRGREFPPLPILGHRLPHLLEAPRLFQDVVRDLEEESQRPPVSGKALHLLPGPAAQDASHRGRGGKEGRRFLQVDLLDGGRLRPPRTHRLLPPRGPKGHHLPPRPPRTARGAPPNARTPARPPPAAPDERSPTGRIRFPPEVRAYSMASRRGAGMEHTSGERNPSRFSSTRARNRATPAVARWPPVPRTSLLIPENVSLVFRPGDDPARLPQERLDLFVGVVEPLLAEDRQSHPLLEEPDRLLEVRLARLQLRDDVFQALQGLFEGGFFRLRRHAPPPRQRFIIFPAPGTGQREGRVNSSEGSIRPPAARTPKWRWGRGARPLEPTAPILSPRATFCPPG